MNTDDILFEEETIDQSDNDSFHFDYDDDVDDWLEENVDQVPETEDDDDSTSTQTELSIPDNVELETLTGTYHSVIWSDSSSGYSILKFRPSLACMPSLQQKLKNGYVTIKGYFPQLVNSMPLKLTGVWESNQYGWTFVVKNWEEYAYDQFCTRDYLSSLNFSKAEVKAISNEFKDLFREINFTGANFRVAACVNCSKERAERIVAIIKSQISKRATLEFISRHGGKMKSVNKLFNAYGADGLDRLKSDPYVIGPQIGLDLDACDSIAREMKMDMNSFQRINAYISRNLKKGMMSGHMFIRDGELIQTIQKQLPDCYIGNLTLTASLKTSNEITFENSDNGKNVYLKYLKAAEDSLAKSIVRLQHARVKTDFKESCIDGIEQAYSEQIPGFTFAQEQRSAFNLLKQTGVGVLTGGPGTGKTTTVKGIIDAYENMYPENKIKLCAPTGRAAQRMTESTGRPATTIHRLLEYKPFEGGAVECKNSSNPIDADFIIIDECSMLDCQLAAMLFDAVKTGTLVILVGDINQLQSVGPGDVLNDFIKSGLIPVERLLKTYRQAADSTIIRNAAEINMGHDELIRAEDFEIYETSNITKVVKDLVEKYHKYDDPFYCQVLSPSHKGDGGVADINQSLQNLLNTGHSSLAYEKTTFRVKDKILMTRNNPDKGYYNGDVGEVLDVSNSEITVSINDQTIVLTQTELEDIKLAYCMTIHKSQGSEFPVVIIALPNSNMLRRNLLYTAITRAKQKVIIVQQRGAIAIAAHRNEVGKRNTLLVQKMKGEANG